MKILLTAAIPVIAALVSTTVLAKTVTVPIQFRQVSGKRPFIPVKLNGVPYLFMLHANAGLYAMTNHRNAEVAHIRVPVSARRYGIEKTGKVSARGRAETRAGILMVGSRSFHDIPLSVFETSQDPPMNGMLGVQWIRASRCIVDYDRKVIMLPDTTVDTAREESVLRARGYEPHSMTWDPAEQRYSIEGTVNGVPVSLNVATVADDILDTSFAREAGIELGSKIGQVGGPTGTLEDQFTTRHAVSITVGGKRMAPSHPLAWNVAGYDGTARSAQKMTIGADFMLANRAVIDFGTGTLYLPRR